MACTVVPGYYLQKSGGAFLVSRKQGPLIVILPAANCPQQQMLVVGIQSMLFDFMSEP